jgi:hypothetical protein
MKKIAVFAISLWFGVAAAANYPRVDEDIQSVDQRMAFLRQGFAKRPVAPKDKEWVKRKLQHMVDLDSVPRDIHEIPALRQYTDDERAEFLQRMDERRLQIDRQNAADLKKLLELYAWFPISKFGVGADGDAWMLVQHADAPFQRQVLTIAGPLAIKRETNSYLFAWLFDHLAWSQQRYGTHGQCSAFGEWEPLPVEDPDNLDARRAQIGLEPMAEYEQRFANQCQAKLNP